MSDLLWLIKTKRSADDQIKIKEVITANERNWTHKQPFHDFYNMTYDRLFRIAYCMAKRKNGRRIVLDIFLKLWKQRERLRHVKTSRTIALFWSERFSLNYLEKVRSTPPFIPIPAPNHKNKLFSGRVIIQ